MVEQWRTSPSFPNYEVSDQARVRRSGRVLKHQVKRGYWSVQVWCDGQPHSARIHRLVCEAFNGPSPQEGLVVEHIDHDKTNNAPDNLRWTTQAENMRRSAEDGRMAWGERAGSAILTEAAVAEIRATPRYYRCVLDLARKYGVAVQTISHVRAGLTWKKTPLRAPDGHKLRPVAIGRAA